jgi:hypothetical protein
MNLNTEITEIIDEKAEKKRKGNSRAVLKYYHKRMAEDEEYAGKLRAKAAARYYARRAAQEQQGAILRKRGRPRTVVL